ncbi:hypothetical protein RvY_03924 [Ramazzottius varieornatus]|uniref:Uncharacterized protein n=1 Tax=Ramazzottius varieornatus TaxID=947166 RepID=A0A1D1UPR1_RAMVA|nr:hypothetical protein RvY_03924 [Ramazzottius varieornatus]
MAETLKQVSLDGPDSPKPQRYSFRTRSTLKLDGVAKNAKSQPRKVLKLATVILAADVETVKKPAARSTFRKKTSSHDARSSRSGRLLRSRQSIQSPRRFEPEPFHSAPTTSLPTTPTAQKRPRKSVKKISQDVCQRKAPRSVSRDSRSFDDDSPIRIITQPWAIPYKEVTLHREVTSQVDNRRKTARRSVSTPRKKASRHCSDDVMDALTGWFSSSQIDQVSDEPSQPSTSSQPSPTPRKKIALRSLEAEEPTQQRLSLSQPLISQNIAEEWKHKVEVSLQRSARKATKSPSGQSTASSKSTRSAQFARPSQNTQSSELIQSSQSTQSLPSSSQSELPSTQPLFPSLSQLLPVSPTYEDSEVTVPENSQATPEQVRPGCAIPCLARLEGDSGQLADLPSSILPALNGPSSPSSSDNESWHSAADRLDVTIAVELTAHRES